jgi:acetylornithine aminotransferase/acetylornithine/N-succinyldiaminopimelate aminotransferase
LDDVVTRESKYVLPIYKRNPVTFVRGEGVRLYDANGREYIDLLSGIGVAALGHAHPGLARAVAEQSQTLIHTSNLFYHPLTGELAERLATLSGLARAFFCNSGTEAVEACLKFARRYWHTKGAPRAEFVALDESFHGRTFGSLSVTSDEHYRAPFEPLLPTVKFVRTNDPAALAAAVTTSTAAIIAESVIGEGGHPSAHARVRGGDHRGVRENRRAAHRRRNPERSGPDRPSVLFQALGLKPHLVAVGKALGGGVPIGSALFSQEVADTVSYGDHGSTYGGNLLACRAALCVLGEIFDGGVAENVKRVGDSFERGCARWRRKHAIVKEVRGAGLMWGVELTRDAGAVVPAALERGVVVNRTAERWSACCRRSSSPKPTPTKRLIVSTLRSAPWEPQHEQTDNASHLLRTADEKRRKTARAHPGEPRGGHLLPRTLGELTVTPAASSSRSAGARSSDARSSRR